ncbi:MAG TPA: hypothetical protein VI248_21145 [Kineosporiaceae bacterium]
MHSADLLTRIGELRRAGLTAPQIARELGLTKAQVQPLLRQVAGSHRALAAEQPLPGPAERELVGCWINPGWSAGLTLADAPDWAATDPEGAADPGTGGLAAVLVARAERASRVTLCGFLVDVYCLGVKDTLGPQTVSSSAVRGRCERFFGGFPDPPRTAPLELAQHLVHGAVAYAASLGFSPHEEFADVEPFLGTAPAPCPIQFGRNGTPWYISGPYDDPRQVITTLERTVGAGHFHYLMGAPVPRPARRHS